jgi:hypothetical protein
VTLEAIPDRNWKFGCSRSLAPVRLAGVPVSTDLVRELAELVDEPTATMLERALETEVLILAPFPIPPERWKSTSL